MGRQSSKEAISCIRKVLKDYEPSDHKQGVLTTVLFMYGLKVKEIEGYLDEYRAKYFENLKKLMKELVREKDELAIKKEATKHLGIKPFRLKNFKERLFYGWDREELIFLLEGPYVLQNVSVADRKEIVKLLGGIDQFQYNFRFYSARDRGPASITFSPPEDYYRKGFITLHKTGLALKGKEIPNDALVKFIFNTFNFSELKEILARNGITQKFQRKRDIIELAKQDKLIRDIIFSQYPEIENVFYFKPLPINFKSQDFVNCWNYNWKIAGFIMHVYGG